MSQDVDVDVDASSEEILSYMDSKLAFANKHKVCLLLR